MTPRDTSVLLLMLLFAVQHGVNSSNNRSLSGKHPSCSLVPKWDICKYHYIQWQREYRWRAYYDPLSNDCYYYRGCPDTNKDLFTFDVDCREACVTSKLKVEQGSPAMCFKKPELRKCDKKVKKFWFDPADLKCKTFFSCENSNRKYWNTKAACLKTCFKLGNKANRGIPNPGLIRLRMINLP